MATYITQVIAKLSADATAFKAGMTDFNDTLKESASNAAQTAARISGAFVPTEAALDKLGTSATAAGAKIKGLGEVAALTGTKIAGFGKAGAAGINVLSHAAAGIAVVGAAAVDFADKFETATLKAAHNSGMTRDQLEDMRKASIQLSNESGEASDKIAMGYMHIANFAYKGADATKIARVAMQDAVGMGADYEMQADLLAKSLSLYGASADKAKNYQATLNVATQQSDQMAQQANESWGTAIGTSKAMHVSFADAAATLSVLSSGYYDAREASTQYLSILNHMSHPMQKQAAAMNEIKKITGIDLHKIWSQAGTDQFNLAYALDQTSKAVQGHTTLTRAMLPPRAGGNALLILAGEAHAKLDARIAATNKAMQTGGGITKNYGDSMETTQRKMMQLSQRMQNDLIPIGEKLVPAIEAILPAIEVVVNGVVKVMDAFAKLPRPVQEAVLAFGAFKAVTMALGNPLEMFGGTVTRFAEKMPEVVMRLTEVEGAEKAAGEAAAVAAGEVRGAAAAHDLEAVALRTKMTALEAETGAEAASTVATAAGTGADVAEAGAIANLVNWLRMAATTNVTFAGTQAVATTATASMTGAVTALWTRVAALPAVFASAIASIQAFAAAAAPILGPLALLAGGGAMVGIMGTKIAQENMKQSGEEMRGNSVADVTPLIASRAKLYAELRKDPGNKAVEAKIKSENDLITKFLGGQNVLIHHVAMAKAAADKLTADAAKHHAVGNAPPKASMSDAQANKIMDDSEGGGKGKKAKKTDAEKEAEKLASALQSKTQDIEKSIAQLTATASGWGKGIEEGSRQAEVAFDLSAGDLKKLGAAHDAVSESEKRHLMALAKIEDGLKRYDDLMKSNRETVLGLRSAVDLGAGATELQQKAYELAHQKVTGLTDAQKAHVAALGAETLALMRQKEVSDSAYQIQSQITDLKEPASLKTIIDLVGKDAWKDMGSGPKNATIAVDGLTVAVTKAQAKAAGLAQTLTNAEAYAQARDQIKAMNLALETQGDELTNAAIQAAGGAEAWKKLAGQFDASGVSMQTALKNTLGLKDGLEGLTKMGLTYSEQFAATLTEGMETTKTESQKAEDAIKKLMATAGDAASKDPRIQVQIDLIRNTAAGIDNLDATKQISAWRDEIDKQESEIKAKLSGTFGSATNAVAAWEEKNRAVLAKIRAEMASDPTDPGGKNAIAMLESKVSDLATDTDKDAGLQRLRTMTADLQKQWMELSAVDPFRQFKASLMEVNANGVLKLPPGMDEASITKLFDLTQKMDRIKTFAGDMKDVFTNALNQAYQHGFKGFFQSVEQGFQKMLADMGMQYVESMLYKALLRLGQNVFGSLPGASGDAGQSDGRAGLSG